MSMASSTKAFVLAIGSLLAMGACSSVSGLDTAVPRGAQIRNARVTTVNPGYKFSAGLLYVALYDPQPPSDRVLIYNTKRHDPSPIAAITDGVSQPQSVCIDGNGTLYVMNQATGSGWVSEYAPGKTKPFTMITQGISGPAFCAIDRRGNLWVTNLNIPDVVEYLKGSTSPHATITNGITYPIGIAIDHFGNLYVANHGNTPNVQVYSPKSKSPSRTITDGVSWPVGIAVDANATLYVTNLSPGYIQEFRVGRSHPYRAIRDEMNGPAAASFGKNGWMYVTNVGVQSGSGPAPAILEFPPGSVTPAKKDVTVGLYDPLGTTYYPPLLP
jgi:hypothetical protein